MNFEMSTRGYQPKGTPRRIERSMHRLFPVNIGTSQDDSVLHTAEDAKTLIRIHARLKAWVVADSVSVRVAELLLHVRPAGQAVVSGSCTEDLEFDVPLQEIARFPVAAIRDNTNGLIVIDEVLADVGAQRKLKKGDELVLSVIANAASNWSVYGNIYTWFKE